MFCSISNQVAQEPVVSRTSGHVFERRLIHKYLDEHGRCPITGDPLSHEDLIVVQQSCSAAGRFTGGGLASISVPALLERLADEWDGVMLEQFSLRQQLTQMRQELAHALQQYDAACRVVASLTRQCEAAQSNTRLPHQGHSAPESNSSSIGSNNNNHHNHTQGEVRLPVAPHKMPVGEALSNEEMRPVLVPPSVGDAMDVQERLVRRCRKQHKLGQQQQQEEEQPQHEDEHVMTAESHKLSFSEVRQVTVSADGPARCVHTRPPLAAYCYRASAAARASFSANVRETDDTLATAGGSAGAVLMRVSAQTGKVTAWGVGHAASIHSITTLRVDGHDDDAVCVVSAAADDTMRVWQPVANKSADDYESSSSSSSESAWTCLHTLSLPDGVTALSQNSIEERYVLAGGREGAVYLCDAERGSLLSSARLHESALMKDNAASPPLMQSGSVHDTDVTCVQLHPYGSMAMIADGRGRMALWDVRGMTVDTMLTLGHKLGNTGINSSSHHNNNHASGYSMVYDACFSMDCVSLAVGLADGWVALWDLRQVEQPVVVYHMGTRELRGAASAGEVYRGTRTGRDVPVSVAFDAQDGSRLLMGGGDGALSIVNVRRLSSVAQDRDGMDAEAEAVEQATLFATSVSSPIRGLCWTRGASAFATASLDGVVRLYETPQ